MPDASSPSPDAVQFRRQLVATIVGAVIGMTTSSGVAFFQWLTESRQQRYEEQLAALSEFAAAVAGIVDIQASDWHLANRCGHIALRAKRLAALPDLTKQSSIDEYKDLLNTAWALELEITTRFQEAARWRSRFSAGYYRVRAAFDKLPEYEIPPLDNIVVLEALTELPDATELRKMAGQFENWGQGFKSDANSMAAMNNVWRTKVAELSQGLREPPT